MIVLDSDFVIDLLENEADSIKKAAELMSSSQKIATTVLNAQEVLIGVAGRSEQKIKDARNFFNKIKVLEYDTDCLFRMVELDRFLKRQGKPIGEFDTMIAGICLENGSAIITRNTAHFERVPGLMVESW